MQNPKTYFCTVTDTNDAITIWRMEHNIYTFNVIQSGVSENKKFSLENTKEHHNTNEK